jgi:ATP-dependent Lon protease
LGKTTLAKKGLANCLKDKNGESRPFSFIALGGSSNGSILDGHNYTYVGSTWGKIVDILIEKKTMNPIIFIDELDKVSRTEHGKEIIGILTHLIDTTQNDGFQDKYFSNIDLDLSKALFIFSYNDVELIDKILLDRIHRIKFENLLLEDKLIITRDYLLPEFYKKFGIENIIEFGDDLVKYIIENYTNEPGVRKLKEILFELISSINLDLLTIKKKYNIPVIITKEIIENILYERHYIRYLKINDYPKVGVVNGLWANAYGNGGILHIESKFILTSTYFDLKLTGMQGDVMKESMTVAKTLAVSLINQNQLKKIVKDFEETKLQGIHVHVPEGATPKDGPSAGAAITLVIYSLLTNKKIKNNFAITGEINLQGSVTAIGGLELKILGGIRAGVKCFLYPKDNAKDFKLFYEKHSNKLAIDNYEFFEIEHISDVIKYMIL